MLSERRMADHVSCCPGAAEDPAMSKSNGLQTSLFQLLTQKCCSYPSPISKLANKEQIQCIPRIRQSFLAMVSVKPRQQ